MKPMIPVLVLVGLLGIVPASAQVLPPCPDEDQDGFLDCVTTVCDPGSFPCGDCDDTNGLIHPAAAEVCDCRDNDCDGVLDGVAGCEDLDPDHDNLICGGDNCPTVANPDQADRDGDGIGDACDSCPDVPEPVDSDRDGVGDVCDNCPSIANFDQMDSDLDGFGDVCDNCPMVFNDTQADRDNDIVGDPCDNCVLFPNPGQADCDGDGFGDVCDNCPPTGPCACFVQRVTDVFIDYKSPAGRGSGLVGWTTTSEVDLVGFNVVEYDTLGNRVAINRVLIPCQECVTGFGASYSFIIPKHRSGQGILIEVVRMSGAVETYGPAVRRQ